MVGIGWNFGYITSSNMIAKLGNFGRERSTIQGVNDTLISIVSAISTMTSATIFNELGWKGLLILG
ncbi:hypothetical protein HK096_010938, partial [Nowakowskiella sp. JEL0078]